MYGSVGIANNEEYTMEMNLFNMAAIQRLKIVRLSLHFQLIT